MGPAESHELTAWPLTARRVNARMTGQFFALRSWPLVPGLRVQQGNNRDEKHSGARAWKGEAKGEGSLVTPFSHLPCPKCHLLSFYPNHNPTRYVIVVMVPASPIRTPKSEEKNIPHESGRVKIWVMQLDCRTWALCLVLDTASKIPLHTYVHTYINLSRGACM